MGLVIFALLVVPWGLHVGFYGLPHTPAAPAVRPGIAVALAVTVSGLVALLLIAAFTHSPGSDLGQLFAVLMLISMAAGVVVFVVLFGLGVAAGRLFRRYHPPARPSPFRPAFDQRLPTVRLREVIGGRVASGVGDTGLRRGGDQVDPLSELTELLAERAAADRERTGAGSR